MLSENCSLLGTDNVCGQITEDVLHQMEAFVYIFPNFQNFFAKKIEGYLTQWCPPGMKISLDVCPWTLSARQSSQFSSSYALRKL